MQYVLFSPSYFAAKMFFRILFARLFFFFCNQMCNRPREPSVTDLCWFANLLADDLPFVCIVLLDGSQQRGTLSRSQPFLI